MRRPQHCVYLQTAIACERERGKKANRGNNYMATQDNAAAAAVVVATAADVVAAAAVAAASVVVAAAPANFAVCTSLFLCRRREIIAPSLEVVKGVRLSAPYAPHAIRRVLPMTSDTCYAKGVFLVRLRSQFQLHSAAIFLALNPAWKSPFLCVSRLMMMMAVMTHFKLRMWPHGVCSTSGTTRG